MTMFSWKWFALHANAVKRFSQHYYRVWRKFYKYRRQSTVWRKRIAIWVGGRAIVSEHVDSNLVWIMDHFWHSPIQPTLHYVAWHGWLLVVAVGFAFCDLLIGTLLYLIWFYNIVKFVAYFVCVCLRARMHKNRRISTSFGCVRTYINLLLWISSFCLMVVCVCGVCFSLLVRLSSFRSFWCWLREQCKL